MSETPETPPPSRPAGHGAARPVELTEAYSKPGTGATLLADAARTDTRPGYAPSPTTDAPSPVMNLLAQPMRMAPPQPPKWRRVASPPGVLPAACLAGFTGAALIPLDRPGIGWLLTGSVAIGAVYLVDRNARKAVRHAAAAPDSIDNDRSAASESAAPDSVRGAVLPPTATSNPGGEDSTRGAVLKSAATSNPGGEDSASGVRAGKIQVAEKAGSAVANSRADELGEAPDSAAPGPRDAGVSKPDALELKSGPASSTPADAANASNDPTSRVPETDVNGERSAEGSPESSGSGDSVVASSEVEGERNPETDGSDSAVAGQDSWSATDRDRRSISAEESAAGIEIQSKGLFGAKSAQIWWAGMLLALLAVGTFRAAGWLFTLCVLAACVAGSFAVVGRRSASGVIYDVLAWPLAALAGIPWVYARLERSRGVKSQRERGIALSVIATVVLLAVFVPLLGGADATFAKLLESVTPEVDGALTFQWIVLFVVVGLAAIGALYVLACPPRPASEFVEEDQGPTLSRLEWALPVGALTVLFAVFVGAQFVALFGGDDYVQRTAGLTYAEYARSGFWQLSAVTVLTLAVILVVLRWAATDSAADRLWLRVLLCAVSVLSLIIVASALGRMWTYQQAYGFTVLRLLVEACELWLGLIYLLVLGAVLSLRRMWLSRAVIGTALATLLALAILNPERLVADKNIDRWQHGKAIDTNYLAELSADVLPATDRLPEPLRTEVRNRIRDHLDPDTWHSWNLSRADARR
ncbi:DUF4153 domain-containing protein [Nocardia sp. NPDC051052]|uniref:DUF4153 domain-containing protein n=1 Tax=Nocardia sp. NPDC051052 TaxID=3364322 RepID=UPI0037A37A08